LKSPQLSSCEPQLRKLVRIISQQRSLWNVRFPQRTSEISLRYNRRDVIIHIQSAATVFTEDLAEPGQVLLVKIPGQWRIELYLTDTDLSSSYIFPAALRCQADFFLGE
jgi:hypothetical protein